jgi:hypothetical protein
MSQPLPPLTPSLPTLPRPWRQMSPTQQQQLAQHWAQLLQRLQQLLTKEKAHADQLAR